MSSLAELAKPIKKSTFDTRDFGAKVDGKQVRDASSTNSTTSTITSATAGFKATDVGKLASIVASNSTASQQARGTITAFISATQVVCTFNVSPTALSNAEFVFGTDDSSALEATFAAALAVRGSVFIPTGISIFSRTLDVPAGIARVYGSGNKPFAGLPEASQHRWTGSTLYLIGNVTEGMRFGTGTANAASDGMDVSNFNIDFVNKASRGVTGASWAVFLHEMTVARTYTTLIELTGSMVVRGCTLFCQQQGSVVKMNPSDTRLVDNYIYGAAQNQPLLSMSGHDQVVTGNHFFRHPDTVGSVGDTILLSNNWGTNIGRGGSIIANNVFDTQRGACIRVAASNNSILQATTIANNMAFQNDVPNNTYSFIVFDVAAGSSIKAISITGNTAQGSFLDGSTLGVWKSFIDGAAILGNVYGCTVVGNAIDNCNALYTSFTPSYSAGNVTIAGYGTTVAVG